MNTRFFFIAFALFSLITVRVNLVAQSSFERIYGGPDEDYGYSVHQTTDGGYVIAGITKSYGSGGKDVYLIKTDAFGDTLWTKSYGGSGWDYGFFVEQTNDGGYIITGHTYSFGAGRSDVYLVKTNAFGDTLWTGTYGGSRDDFGYSVQQTTDGGYIITGSTSSFADTLSDFYLIKTDASGDTLWTKTYGGSDRDAGSSVQQTSDGNYVVVGMTQSFGSGSSDVYLIRTDNAGDTLWTRTYGGQAGDYGISVQQTSDGGYIMSGSTNADIYLIKTNASGDTLWTRTYGGSGIESGQSVQQTSDGGYIIAGSTYSPQTSTGNVYLVRTDTSGDTLWTREYGGDDSDYGWSIQQTIDGGYVISGETESSGSGLFDVYLIKVNSDGNVGIDSEACDVLQIPKSFFLSQNYPNPFNPSTTITFDVAGEAGEKQHTTLTVYDLRGRLVKMLVDSEIETGLHKVVWDGKNEQGQQVSSGIYLYTLKSGEKIYTRKMVVVK